MKKRIALACLLALGFWMSGFDCASSLLASHRPAAAVPVAGEKIFVQLPVDSSAVNALAGWPDDKASQTLLILNYRRMYDNLLVEFRRSEKYGLYEIVDDSLAATTSITPIILRCSLKNDTLTLPVRLNIRQGGMKKDFSLTFSACGAYRAHSKPKSPLHYLDALLADFCRSFPYKRVVGKFYSSRAVGGADREEL